MSGNTRRETRKEWFTVPEAARILGVSYQAIYDAVRKGRLRAVGKGWQRRIHIEDILSYGIRRGKDPQELISRLRKEREVSWEEVLLWVMAGLGLGWLLAKILKEKAK